MFAPHLARLAALLHPTDACEEWNPEPADAAELPLCERERCDADDVIADFEVVDLQERAASVRYQSGRVKRTRYRPVPLHQRRVVLALHQAGVERRERRWRASGHRVTGHRLIGPTGTRYKVHPLDVRLVATNRFDRAPWACICIEFLGNFERIDGTGTWWAPERMGRGRAGVSQIEAGRAEVRSICTELEEQGITVEAVVPHIIAGRDRRGNPNRHACCGSRVWSEVGEWAGAELGLRVPAPGFALGGLPVPDAWHGPYWGRCTRLLTG